ncbi:hypothetical protein Droror1_Dr00004133 [Drosera rotundifolia]
MRHLSIYIIGRWIIMNIPSTHVLPYLTDGGDRTEWMNGGPVEPISAGGIGRKWNVHLELVHWGHIFTLNLLNARVLVEKMLQQYSQKASNLHSSPSESRLLKTYDESCDSGYFRPTDQTPQNTQSNPPHSPSPPAGEDHQHRINTHGTVSETRESKWVKSILGNENHLGVNWGGLIRWGF